jgi:Flp pilus assembly protein TadD
MHDDDRRGSIPTTIAPRNSAPPSDNARDVAGEEFLFHLYRGSELLQDARVHEAKEELEHALLLQPRDPKGQDLLATVYFRIGLYPRAIQIYELLRRDNPEDAPLKINLALCYLKTGQANAARLELEDVVRRSPDHKRAWGYLGLAYERLNEHEKAVGAFTRGGHSTMARRIADRHGPVSIRDVTPAAEHEAESIAVRAAAAKAFQELDAGELSFALAEPTIRRGDMATGTWRAVELGQAIPTGRRSDPPPSLPVTTPPPPAAESARVQSMAEEAAAAARLPGAPTVPDLPDLSNLRSARPVVVTPASVPPAPPPATHPSVIAKGFAASTSAGDENVGTDREAPAAPEATLVSLPSQTLTPLTELVERARFIGRAGEIAESMALDAGGLLTLRLDRGDVAARLETMRGFTGTLDAVVLERRSRSGGSGESFGGIGGAVQRLRGNGLVVIAPRPSRHIFAFTLANEIFFVREELVVAFDLALAFENGKVVREDDEPLAIAQLRGTGSVAIELADSPRTFEVTSAAPAAVRASSVLGWVGRLVPRALPPGEAPGAHHGLLAFSGEGRVLVAGR